MKRWEVWSFHILTMIVTLSGTVYLWMKYLLKTDDPFSVINHPWQPAMLAAHVLTSPALLLADEPTGNIDTKTGRAIMALIGELHAEGRTILMVTHDPAIAGHGERFLEMQDGQLREGG